MKTIWFSILLLLVCHAAPAQIDRITGKSFATRSEVLARHGMVCTSVPAATQVGIGELFSMEAGHANVYAPGKRPFHTIIPGFVMKDGKAWEAFGVTGGGMQPQGHVQVLTNQIDFDLNVQEAGDASRWQHEGDNERTGEKMETDGYVNLESGIPAETQRELKKRGHDVRRDVGGYGGYQAIKVEMYDGQRVYVGASESRKDGQAAGY